MNHVQGCIQSLQHLQNYIPSQLSLTSIIKKLAFFFFNLPVFKTLDPSFQAIMLNQEHLSGHMGSHFYLHKPHFLALIDETEIEEGGRLGSELANMMGLSPLVEAAHHVLFPLRIITAIRLERQLLQLEDGQSMWVDASTRSHAMVMRITRTGDTFSIQFSNTGSGIVENHDFHPTHKKNKKTLYQTTAPLNHIPREKLNRKWFRNFLTIRYTQSSLYQDMQVFLEDQKETKKNDVSLIYGTLRWLGEPSISADERDFSRPQIAGSCVPSSLWSLFKSNLTKENFKILRTYSRLKHIVSQYQSIKNNYSDTSAIALLDVIEKIKTVFDKQRQDVPAILLSIEEELKEGLKAPYAMVKIKNNTKYHITDLIQNSESVIPSLKATLTQKDGYLTANVVYTPCQTISPFRVEVGEDQKIRGKHAIDSLYLLYLHASSGNESEAVRLSHVLIEALTYPRAPDRADLSQNKIFTISHFIRFLYQLAMMDNTRSGIAKRIVFLKIAQIMVQKWCYPEDKNYHALLKTINTLTEHAQEIFDNLNIEKYLPNDHPWIGLHYSIDMLKNNQNSHCNN